MKAQVETTVRMNDSEDEFAEALFEFAKILQCITATQSEDSIRSMLNVLKQQGEMNHFMFGFGSNHLWVHQLNSFGKPYSERIIFVEF